MEHRKFHFFYIQKPQVFEYKKVVPLMKLPSLRWQFIQRELFVRLAYLHEEGTEWARRGSNPRTSRM